MDYDNITSKFCCARFEVDFKFSNGTLQGLSRALANLPIEEIQTDRLNLKLGKSADGVSIYNIIDLVIMASRRVNIDIEDVDVDNMI